MLQVTSVDDRLLFDRFSYSLPLIAQSIKERNRFRIDFEFELDNPTLYDRFTPVSIGILCVFL